MLCATVSCRTLHVIREFQRRWTNRDRTKISYVNFRTHWIARMGEKVWSSYPHRFLLVTIQKSLQQHVNICRSSGRNWRRGFIHWPCRRHVGAVLPAVSGCGRRRAQLPLRAHRLSRWLCLPVGSGHPLARNTTTSEKARQRSHCHCPAGIYRDCDATVSATAMRPGNSTAAWASRFGDSVSGDLCWLYAEASPHFLRRICC
jgi:hypothetical protein